MKLIDADKLIEKWEEDLKHMDDFAFEMAVLGAINDVKRQDIVIPEVGYSIFPGDTNLSDCTGCKWEHENFAEECNMCSRIRVDNYEKGEKADAPGN